MIIVKIIGGLGNQMFQYAFAKALEKRGNNVKIDISTYDNYKLHGGYQLDLYNIDLGISTKEENAHYISNNFFSFFFMNLGFNFSKKTKEKSLLFDKTLLSLGNNQYVEGYFQSEKYFIDIRDIIINQFTIKDDLSNYSKSILNLIITSKNTCSVHVRRGDFVNEINQKIHGSCSLKYYITAIQKIQKIRKKTKFFVFSDDVNWCRENLKLENVIIINNNEKRIPHEDIHLMSLCDDNIISNSTFGWWGAWLNQNEFKTVIAPNRWFSNEKLELQSKFIVCNDWIKI